MAQAARVIDLDTVRAKRSLQKQTAIRPQATPQPAPVVWVPILVWVPFWNVA